MALTIITQPAVEPLTTAEAKSHLRVDITDDDTLIDAYVSAGRQLAQAEEGRAYITTVFELTLDRFPAHRVIRLPMPPCITVDSIKYYDTDEALQTWDASKYIVDIASEPARIQPIDTESWPTTQSRFGAIQIRFTAGYGAAGTAVPERVRSAIRLYIGHWYENRQAVEVGTISTAVQIASHALLMDMVDGADYGD